jgi:hypothetical protein
MSSSMPLKQLKEVDILKICKLKYPRHQRLPKLSFQLSKPLYKNKLWTAP